jgi:hypothetical protein
MEILRRLRGREQHLERMSHKGHLLLSRHASLQQALSNEERNSVRRKADRDLQLIDGKATYELSKYEKEEIENGPWVSDHDLEIYSPPAAKKITKKGAWIMIIRAPKFGSKFKKLRAGQVHWADQDDEADEQGFNPKGVYKVTVKSPWGEFKLYPYEYSVVTAEWIIGTWSSGEYIFHLKKANVKLNDILFYIRSRGIPFSQAVPMALGSFDKPVGWFEPTEELQAEIDATFGYTTGLAVLGGRTYEQSRKKSQENEEEAVGEESSES